MNDTDLAWAAGFIDGEGCISINKSSKKTTFSYSLRIHVGQKYKSPLEKLSSILGGNITWGKDKNSNQGGDWRWTLNGYKASNALTKILPYLTIKKSQALLGIFYQPTVQSSTKRVRLTEIEVAERDSFWLAMKELKNEYS